MPSDKPTLVSVLVVQVVEASLRLVAVNSALADRSKSVALNLLKPLPNQSDWEEFVQSVENLDPVQILAHLNVGEEALPPLFPLQEADVQARVVYRVQAGIAPA